MRKDIDFSFIRHPITGDLSVKKGSSAISQSIRNIVLTNFYERGFNIELGTNLSPSLFDNIDELTSQTVKQSIDLSLKTFEPNIEVIDVVVDAQREQNSLNVHVIYTEFNNPEEKITSVDLTRLR